MSRLERYFDRLMHQYYMVLVNAWTDSVKDAAKFAIKELVALNDNQRADETYLKDLEYNLRQKLGEDFANALDQKVKSFCELSYKVAVQEPQFSGNKDLRFTPADMRNIELIKKQQIFWLKHHYDGTVSEKLQDILTKSIENKWSRLELADELQTCFKDVIKASYSYFEGLAEHTSLRVREFGRLTNYQKLGAKYYQIVAVIDERTSDVCLALDGQVFPLKPAIKCMNAMFDVSEMNNYETAKKRLKELAPFASEKDVVYDETTGEPIGINGHHTPFPPFHWRCRTRTIMLQNE